MLAALLVTAAVFCLLMAVVPRGGRAARGLAFIRTSTLDARPPRTPPAARAHELLRRLALRLGLGARWVSRQDLVEAGIDPEVFTPAEATALKLLLAAVTGGVCLAMVAALPGTLVLAPAAAWAAFVAPSFYISRRRARRRAEVLGELPDLVGLLRAFTNASVPLEQALHLISGQLIQANPGNILAAELSLALGQYGLGETIGTSLERMADRVGVDELRTLVAAIAQENGSAPAWT